MDRKLFDSMDILNQIDFINTKLLEHGSLTKVCNEEDLRRSTISDRFRKHGYELIDKQYRLIDSPVEAHNPSSDIINHNNIKPLTEANSRAIVNVSNDINILDMIQALQKEVMDLKEEVHQLKANTPKVKIKDIELMSFTGTTENKSFRVDSNVLKDFDIFCKKNKKYKKQDLLSQAIQEFIDKYK